MSVHFCQFTKTIIALSRLACKGQIIYHSFRNIQSLAIEIFFKKANLLEAISCNILKTRTMTYISRSQTDFVRDHVNTRGSGLISLQCYFTPVAWDMVLLETKNINSLQKFKTEIRKWVSENCSCYCCQPYTQNLVFVELV